MKTKGKINMCPISDEYFIVKHGFLVVVPSEKLHDIYIDLETYINLRKLFETE